MFAQRLAAVLPRAGLMGAHQHLLSARSANWTVRAAGAGANAATAPARTASRSFAQFTPAKFDDGPTVGDIKIRQNLEARQAWTVDEGTTVFDATKKMVDGQTGSLCVTRNGNIVGIITEHDYLCKVVHEGRTSHNTIVDDICQHEEQLLVACTSDLVEDCLTMMVSKDIRDLPVMDEHSGDIVALMSLKDIAKALGRIQAETFKNMNEVRIAIQMPIHDG